MAGESRGPCGLFQGLFVGPLGSLLSRFLVLEAFFCPDQGSDLEASGFCILHFEVGSSRVFGYNPERIKK